MIKLYDDQIELLDKVRASMRQGNKSVLMQLATGGGKSIIAGAMIAGSRSKGTRCGMLVPRRELLKQITGTFEKYEISHSYVAAGMPYNPFANSYIMMAQTVAKRLDKLPKLDLLIIDEVHFGGDGIDKIIQHYKSQGTRLIGLSATPIRSDSRGLDCWFDAMVCGQSMRWLMDNNRLSDYRLFAPSKPNLDGIGKVAGDYNKGQLSARMEEDKILIGDAARYYKQHAMGKLGITFTTSRAHSIKVAEEFRNQGIPAHHIDGTMDDAERTRITRMFARGEILQLVNCELCTFGYDLASASGLDVTIEVMTDLAPTLSLAKQLQKWGRTLRIKSQPALIFDHAGNITRHGLPDDEREWSLEGMQKGSKEKGEKTIPVKQCIKCFHCHNPAPKCPNCGNVYEVKAREIEHIDGELVEIKSGDKVVVVPKARSKQFRALMQVARKKGIANPEAFATTVINRQAGIK